METNKYSIYIYPAAEGAPDIVELRAFRGREPAIILPVSIMSLAKLAEDSVAFLAEYLRKTG